VHAVLPLLLALAILPGFLLGRRGTPPALARDIQRVIYWGWLPIVPLALAGAPLASAGLAVAAGTAGLFTTAIVAGAYARRRFPESADRAAFTLAAFWGNTGWLGVPVTVALLGTGALPAALLYANVASAPHNFLVGGTIAASHGRRVTGRTLLAAFRRNHYLLPTAIGLAWAVSGVPRPPGTGSLLAWLAPVVALPAFFALGLILARVPLRPDRDTYAALVIRLGLSPVLLLSMTPFLAVPRPFLVQAGMATGLNTLNFAGEHGLPVRLVAPTIAWSTMLVLTGAAVWLAVA
jgi:predicted permease